MGSTMKKIAVILILTAFLAPGVAQARVFPWESGAVSRDTESGFFGVVWNLLANMFDKNGGMLDPSGAPNPEDPGGTQNSTGSTTTTDGSDNGGILDPSGND